jgi:OOP family OmpA-OmpF porin
MVPMTMRSILVLTAIAGAALAARGVRAEARLSLGPGGLQAGAGATPEVPPALADSDGDGVPDTQDRCPGTRPGTRVDGYGCELDADGDGVLDKSDQCPATLPGVRVDAGGCEFKDEIKLPGVVFAPDKVQLLAESFPVLNAAIATLSKYPELRILVAGYTDNRGSDAHNLQLSQRRAEAVAKYLKDGGATNELKAVGYGEAQPVADNRSKAGREQNRRIVLKILEQ